MTTRAVARAKADELWCYHEQGLSWRDIQKQHYPDVNWATLNRVALSKGEWLPKKRSTLQALGLIEKPREWLPGELRTARKIGRMARETKEKVLKR